VRLGRKNPLVNAWKKKKKKTMRKRDLIYQKERNKEPKKEKEINSLKEPRPHQARHPSSWRSSST